MDTLRLVLIIAGAVFILAIYLYSRVTAGKSLLAKRPSVGRQKQKVPKPASTPASDEDITESIRNRRYASDVPEDSFIDSLSMGIGSETSSELESEEIEPVSSLSDEDSSESLLVVFNIMARHDQMLAGETIQAAMHQAGFQHGEMGIFHYHDITCSDARAICSVANIVEPGNFDLQTIESIESPGLVLFLQLPGPLDGRVALEQTLILARQLAEYLDADLCDETRSVLTMQTIEHLKEKIEMYRFKSRMAQIKNHRQ